MIQNEILGKRKKFIIQPPIKYSVCFDASDEERHSYDKQIKRKMKKGNSHRTACCRTSEQKKLEHKFINIETSEHKMHIAIISIL